MRRRDWDRLGGVAFEKYIINSVPNLADWDFIYEKKPLPAFLESSFSKGVAGKKKRTHSRWMLN